MNFQFQLFGANAQFFFVRVRLFSFSFASPQIDYEMDEREMTQFNWRLNAKRVVFCVVCCCVYRNFGISHFSLDLRTNQRQLLDLFLFCCLFVTCHSKRQEGKVHTIQKNVWHIRWANARAIEWTVQTHVECGPTTRCGATLKEVEMWTKPNSL